MRLTAHIAFKNKPVANSASTAVWLREYFKKQLDGGPVRLIEGFSLQVKPGEVLAVVGESGAGKTTLLRILSGLDNEFEGEVRLDGEQIIRPDRRLYLMPQEHTLLPWFNVERNLLFFARRNGDSHSEKAVDSFLKRLDLTKLRHAYPKTLSGGERARVALACAMIAEPHVFLLDEPFKSLDQVTSERCQNYLVEWLEETVIEESVVIVSHSISDAVFLGDRLIVVGSNPLSIHMEFNIPRPRVRRSEQLLEIEREVVEALNEIDVLQRSTANGAASRS